MLQKTKTANAIDLNVGARVRDVRVGLAMSQEKLGEKVGVTFQQIQKYEKGMNRMGASRLVQISQALSVSPAYLLADYLPEGETASAPIVEATLRAELVELREKLSKVRKIAA